MTNKYYLDSVEWGEFEIGKIFEVSGTITTHPSKLIVDGKTPRITCSASNNGLDDTYGNFPTEKGGVLTIDSATIGYVSYQESDFIATDHVEKVLFNSNIKMNRYIGLFIKKCIDNSVQNKYGYGYKFSQQRIKKQKILLPKDSSGNPNWDFMENYMREKEREQIKTALDYYKAKISQKHINEMSLGNCEWKEFEIGSLFILFQGKSKGLNHLHLQDDGVNYLGATNKNNGVMCQVQRNEKMIQKGNCIAFIRNGEGSMGYSIYKKEDFIATSDISVGYSNFLTQNTGLFITTVADRIRGKYNFGYKRSDSRLKKEKILLPVDSAGEPDWVFMEKYMQYQEQKLVRQYIEKVEKRI